MDILSNRKACQWLTLFSIFSGAIFISNSVLIIYYLSNPEHGKKQQEYNSCTNIIYGNNNSASTNCISQSSKSEEREEALSCMNSIADLDSLPNINCLGSDGYVEPQNRFPENLDIAAKNTFNNPGSGVNFHRNLDSNTLKEYSPSEENFLNIGASTSDLGADLEANRNKSNSTDDGSGRRYNLSRNLEPGQNINSRLDPSTNNKTTAQSQNSNIQGNQVSVSKSSEDDESVSVTEQFQQAMASKQINEHHGRSSSGNDETVNDSNNSDTENSSDNDETVNDSNSSDTENSSDNDETVNDSNSPDTENSSDNDETVNDSNSPDTENSSDNDETVNDSNQDNQIGISISSDLDMILNYLENKNNSMVTLDYNKEDLYQFIRSSQKRSESYYLAENSDVTSSNKRIPEPSTRSGLIAFSCLVGIGLLRKK
jgi:hypothetical protein